MGEDSRIISRYSDRRRSVEGDRAFKLVEVSRLRSSSSTFPRLGYAVVNCSTPRPSTRIPRACISIHPFYPFAVTSSGSRYTCLPFIDKGNDPSEYFHDLFVSREPDVAKPRNEITDPTFVAFTFSFHFSIFIFRHRSSSKTHGDDGGGGDIVVKTITTSQSVVLIV